MREVKALYSGVVRVLSFDPGTKNFAYSVLDYNIKKKKVKLVDIGTLVVDESPLSYSLNFEKSFGSLITKEIDFVVAERFMFRGVSSIYSEKVNFLLGLASLVLKKRGLSLFLVPASLWKRFFTWKGKKGKDKKIVKNSPYGKYVFDTVHESDAAHLGYWYIVRGVFNHLTAIKKRLEMKEPVFACKNCKYWLWKKHNKNQTPCSELGGIKNTDYCSDFNALSFTRTTKLSVTEKRVLDIFGWRSMRNKLKEKGFVVSKFHAYSKKHNVLFSVKPRGKKFLRIKKKGYEAVSITSTNLKKVKFQWNKIRIVF